jgi:hypothetical protein
MNRFIHGTLVAAAMSVSGGLSAQDVAPLFQQAPAVLYETYKGVDAPVFNEYFELLVERYAGTNAFGWGVYRENSTVAYRITALPNRLQSMLEVQQARNEGFQDMTEHHVDLWNRAWQTRHVAVYGSVPAASVVPEGFTVADIQALPYNRVTVYHLKWDQVGAFREALNRRSELDREAGIDDFVLTGWAGGIGTESQTFMIRVSAASQAADIGPNRDARRAARESYRAEFGRLSGIMNASARHIERHDQGRVAALSHVPGE